MGMTMKPIANWRAVLRYAWSVRLMLLAAALSGLEIVLQLAGAMFLPPMALGMLSGFVTMFALVARFVAQDLEDR